MELERIEELLDEFSEAAQGCGDVEYVFIQNIRCALADYIVAMRKTGPGKPRTGYQEKELKL